jgi:hypothetical protein
MSRKVTLKTLETHARLLGVGSLTHQAYVRAIAAKAEGKRVSIYQHLTGFSVSVANKRGEVHTMRFG